MDELLEALEEWASDYDEGWGDLGASGDRSEGGYTLLDHGDEHTAKSFRVLRAFWNYDLATTDRLGLKSSR